MKKAFLALPVLVLVSLFMSCTPKIAPVEKASPPETTEARSNPSVKEAWEVEWDKTLKLAQKEGSVTIMGGSGAAALKDGVAMIRQKFGFSLEITSGRGSEILAKISTERRAGIYAGDLIFTGHGSMFMMKRDGMYEPLGPRLLLPEVIDPKVWIWGKVPWADEDRYIINVAYFPNSSATVNTTMVQPGEIKSYYDYLNPKWKDKIVMGDVTVTGSAGPLAFTLVHNKVLNLDYFRQLVLQKPVLIRDDELVAKWLATGKYAIAMFPSEGVMAKYKDAGAPLLPMVEMKEAQVLSAGGMALAWMNKAPHPNAATVFVNWLLSKEGSTFIQNIQQKQSARVDVSPEGLDPVFRRSTGVEYIRKSNEVEDLVISGKEEEFYGAMREVLAPVLR